MNIISRITTFWRRADSNGKIQCGIVVAGWAVAIALYLFNQCLSGDEAMLAVNIVEKTFGQLLFSPLEYRQSAPPLFLLVEKFFSLILPNEYGLRAFPLLCHLAMLPLFLMLCRKIISNPAAQTVAVAMMAFSGMVVSSSSAVKQYNCEMFLAVAIILIALRCRERWDVRNLVLLATFGAVIILFSNVAVIYLATVGTWLFVIKICEASNIKTATTKKSRIRPLFLMGLIWGLVFLCNYVNTLRVNEDTHEFMLGYWGRLDSTSPYLLPKIFKVDTIQLGFCPAKFPDIIVFGEAWFRFNNFFGCVFGGQTPFFPPKSSNPTAFVLAALTFIGAIVAARKRNPIFIFAFCPAVLQIAVSMFKLYPLSTRFCLHLYPALILLAGLGVQALIGRMEWRKQKVASLSVVFLLFASILWFMSVNSENTGFKYVFKKIAREMEDADRVFITDRFQQRAFNYYKSLPELDNMARRVVEGWADFSYNKDYDAYNEEIKVIDERILQEIRSLEGKVWIIGASFDDNVLYEAKSRGVMLKTVSDSSGNYRAFLFDFGVRPHG